MADLTLRTPLCDLLDIKYPIVLAGMGWGRRSRARRGGVKCGRIGHTRGSESGARQAGGNGLHVLAT